MLMATLVTLVVLATIVNFYWVTAMAHGGYPMECCNSQDCAPAESLTWSLPTSTGIPQLVVRSMLCKVTVPGGFPVRQAKDGRAHVCMPQNECGSLDVVCLFIPPPA
jgi:hypothetical protein